MCFLWFSENVGIPETKSRNYMSCNENLDSQLWIQIYLLHFLVMIGESFAKRWTNDPSMKIFELMLCLIVLHPSKVTWSLPTARVPKNRFQRAVFAGVFVFGQWDQGPPINGGMGPLTHNTIPHTTPIRIPEGMGPIIGSPLESPLKKGIYDTCNRLHQRLPGSWHWIAIRIHVFWVEVVILKRKTPPAPKIWWEIPDV